MTINNFQEPWRFQVSLSLQKVAPVVRPSQPINEARAWRQSWEMKSHKGKKMEHSSAKKQMSRAQFPERYSAKQFCKGTITHVITDFSAIRKYQTMKMSTFWNVVFVEGATSKMSTSQNVISRWCEMMKIHILESDHFRWCGRKQENETQMGGKQNTCVSSNSLNTMFCRMVGPFLLVLFCPKRILWIPFAELFSSFWGK